MTKTEIFTDPKTADNTDRLNMVIKRKLGFLPSDLTIIKRVVTRFEVILTLGFTAPGYTG